MSSAKAGKRSTKEIVKDKFFAFLAATSLTRGLDKDHIHLSHSYGRNCLLLGWSHQPYEEAIKAMHEARPGVSEKTIGRVLTRSMVKLFNQYNVSEDADPQADAPVLDSILDTLDSSAVSEEVTNLLDLLKSHIKMWSAVVFVEGIELKGLTELPLRVATLYPRDHGPLVDALEDAKNRGLANIVQFVETAADHCRCYAVIDTEGGGDFVNHQSLRQAESLMSVLNLYAVSSPHRASSDYQPIGILGQPTSTRPQFVLKYPLPVAENERPTWSYFIRPPPPRCHKIDSARVQKWKEHGLDKVLECIELPDTMPGSAESRIRNAITWYGRAMKAYTPDEQFVSLTIALESLLVVDERVSIAQRLADGVSALVGTDFQSRQCIAERTRDLYDLRGRIVHAGMPVSQQSLSALHRIVANTILAFVRREMPRS